MSQTIKAETLAELILKSETLQVREPMGYRQDNYDHDLTNSLDHITSMFLTTTSLGKVVEKEGLTAKALHTYRTTDSDKGWSGIEVTLQEGISHYISIPRFYESFRRNEILKVSIDAQQWPNFFQESIALLQWLSRARKMLAEDIWLPQTA